MSFIVESVCLTQGSKLMDSCGGGGGVVWRCACVVDEYPLPFLHEYSLLFPSSPYTSLIIGYLRYFGRPGPNDETAEELRRKRRERRRVGRGKKEGKGKKVGEGEKNEEEDGEVEGKAEEKENEDNKRKEPFTIIVVSTVMREPAWLQLIFGIVERNGSLSQILVCSQRVV